MKFNNRIEIDGCIAEMEIFCKKEPKIVLIDADDVPRLQELNRRWSGHKPRDTSGIYVYAADGTRVINGKPTRVFPQLLLHRFLLNAPSGWTVDHWNHNTLDCRKTNLRIVSHGANSLNRSNPMRGITQCRSGWDARIHVRDVDIMLGKYPTVELAQAAVAGAFRVANRIIGLEDEERLSRLRATQDVA